MNLRLILSGLKLGRWGIIAWAGIIFIYAVFTIYLYPTISESPDSILSYLNSLPEAMKAAFGYEGIDFTALNFTPEAFATMEFLVLWPLLIGIYGIFVNVGIAREAERGTLDLLLAQPIKRYKVLSSKFIIFTLSAVLIAAASIVGVVVGAQFIDDPVDVSVLSLALVESLLMVLAISGITLFFSALFLQPRRALMASGIVVAGMYIVNFIVPVLGESVNWVRNFSLFYHYQPFEIVNSSSLNGTAVLLFSLTAIISFTAALIIFQRRDLTT